MTCLPFLLVLMAWCSCVAQWAQPAKQSVFFERQVVDDSLVGDYGVQSVDLDKDGQEDLVAYAWATGSLVWYRNNNGGEWTKKVLGIYKGVVDVDFFDVNSDGHIDIIFAWDLNIPPQSNSEGQIGWIRNGDWTYFAINKEFLPGVHRVKIGNFSGSSIGVIGLPIFGFGAKSPWYNDTTCQITHYSMPASPETGGWWTATLLSDELHVCHTVRKHEMNGKHFLVENSLEGVTRITVDSFLKASLYRLSSGLPPVSWSPFYGSQGSVACKVHGEDAFLAEIGPWEGVEILSPVTVSVLVPSNPGVGLFSGPLKRIPLDVLGPQAHDVACGDFNQDGCDDILVGIRGPVMGIWMFLCNGGDPTKPFNFFPLSLDRDYGASQLAVADFNGDGHADWASTGFPGFGGLNDPSANKYVAVYYWQNKSQN